MAPDERSDRAGPAAGSTNPFDFDQQPVDRSNPLDGTGRDPRSARGRRAPDDFDPFGLDTGAQPGGRSRTGQRVSWTALILVVVGAVASGAGIGGALGSITLDAASPFGSMLWWGTLALLGFLIIVIALVTAIVGMVQADPRMVATIALIGAVLLGWVAAYVGYKIGAHQLAGEAVRVVGTSGPDAIPAISTSLRERGIDVGPFLPLLRQVFRR